MQNYGSIASAHPLATQAGLRILKEGGNAFDATVAVSATLSVVEPGMSGIGGYGTTLIYDAKTKKILSLNHCGKFPLKTNSDYMRPPNKNFINNRKASKSISTPSNLNAWNMLHSKYGKQAWENLFKDAIYYARKGFVLNHYSAKVIATSFNEFSDYAKNIFGKNGLPFKYRDKLIQNDLANTYELISIKGIEPFYRGEIAERIDKEMKELGGFLSIKDLKNDGVEWQDSMTLNYKGYDIHCSGIPGNGFITLLILGIMQNYSFRKNSYNSSKYLHFLIESLKYSTKIRLSYPGCPFLKEKIMKDILNMNNFQKVAQGIDNYEASNFIYHNTNESSETSHFVITDKFGNIVSSTQTLGLAFGSKVMIKNTGIWMNSAMSFAKFEPKGNPLDILPGESKLSSNSPVIILKNNLPWAALGTLGGHTIQQNVAQIVINLIDFGMSMQEAISAPKVSFFEEDTTVVVENDISRSVIVKLRKYGHKIEQDYISSYVGISNKIGNAMGIRILQKDNQVLFDLGVDKRRLF